MTIHMSACGVICSACPAYLAGQSNDCAERERVAAAWHEIYAGLWPGIDRMRWLPGVGRSHLLHLAQVFGTPLLPVARSGELRGVRRPAVR